jgi:predicted MFS family arabinose efflux permease
MPNQSRGPIDGLLVLNETQDVGSPLAGQGLAESSDSEVAVIPRHAGFVKRHGSLIILTAVYSLAFIDRQVLSILQESIKHELGLSDSQLGLLTGFSFALFYSLLGIPLGRLADRWNRRDLVAISIVVWSGFTALTGYASSFTFLLLTRIVVAIGEAGSYPASVSIITAAYPPTRRAAAMTFYTTGTQIGILIGFMIGGWLDAALGWRWAFVIVGAPGVVVGLLFRLVVREPVRATVHGARTPFLEGFRNLAASKTLRLLTPAVGLSSLVAYSSMTWAAPFLMRVHGFTAQRAGVWLALGIGVGGTFGAIGSGFLVDRLALRDRRWFLWLPAILTALIVPFQCGALMAHDGTTACLLYLFPFAFSTVYAGIAISVITQIAPSQFRATATALYLMICNIFGIGLGSWIIGITSDLFAPRFGNLSLQVALLSIVPAAAALAVLLYVLAARTLRQDLLSI